MSTLLHCVPMADSQLLTAAFTGAGVVVGMYSAFKHNFTAVIALPTEYVQFLWVRDYHVAPDSFEYCH